MSGFFFFFIFTWISPKKMHMNDQGMSIPKFDHNLEDTQHTDGLLKMVSCFKF